MGDAAATDRRRSGEGGRSLLAERPCAVHLVEVVIVGFRPEDGHERAPVALGQRARDADRRQRLAEREERAAGKGSRAALEAAAATSGRSILISGITVMVAMAGMLFSGDKTYLSFGVATMMVVAIAMLGSLTVLPALLSRLDDKIEKGRIPFLGKLRR